MHHDEVDMPAVMKLRRQALDMTQPELAEIVGIGTRQIARYEAGEQQPAFNVAVKIADALEITVDQLAGNYSPRENLGGGWWANWQVILGEKQYFPHQHVEAVQRGERIILEAEEGFARTPEAGFAWTGELRPINHTSLIGWFKGEGKYQPTCGSFFLHIDETGGSMTGRWTGEIAGFPVATGKFILDRHRANESVAIPNADEPQLNYLDAPFNQPH